MTPRPLRNMRIMSRRFLSALICTLLLPLLHTQPAPVFLDKPTGQVLVHGKLFVFPSA
jgi:hypothetical protein